MCLVDGFRGKTPTLKGTTEPVVKLSSFYECNYFDAKRSQSQIPVPNILILSTCTSTQNNDLGQRIVVSHKMYTSHHGSIVKQHFPSSNRIID